MLHYDNYILIIILIHKQLQHKFHTVLTSLAVGKGEQDQVWYPGAPDGPVQQLRQLPVVHEGCHVEGAGCDRRTRKGTTLSHTV